MLQHSLGVVDVQSKFKSSHGRDSVGPGAADRPWNGAPEYYQLSSRAVGEDLFASARDLVFAMARARINITKVEYFSEVVGDTRD